jgi:hypothetical protein
MNRETIGRLMEKYFDGQTSLEEERQLRDYFRNGNVAPEWESCKFMFNYFSEEREKSEMIRQQEQSQNPPKRRHGRWRKKSLLMVLWTTAAAACMLLFFTLNGRFALPYSGGEHEISGQSLAYINGQKFTDIETIRSETLNSLKNLAEGDDNVYSLQVEALEIFTDK